MLNECVRPALPKVPDVQYKAGQISTSYKFASARTFRCSLRCSCTRLDSLLSLPTQGPWTPLSTMESHQETFHRQLERSLALRPPGSQPIIPRHRSSPNPSNQYLNPPQLSSSFQTSTSTLRLSMDRLCPSIRPWKHRLSRRRRLPPRDQVGSPSVQLVHHLET